MDLNDALERTLSGDRQAFAVIVRYFEEPLFAFLGRMGLTQTRAEEVAQETFLRAWTRLADFDAGKSSFATWLYTIARRLALNALARAHARHEIALPADDAGPSDWPQPPEMVALDDQRRALRSALLQLSLTDRTALALAYIDGLSLAEIGRVEGCSVGAVKTRLHRARLRLGQLLDAGDA
jgi:RNA polymerase sigma-70 factor (ECF subfamily)